MNPNPVAFHPPLPPTHSASFIVWRHRKVEVIFFPISAVVHLVIGIIRLVKQCSEPAPDTDYSVAYAEYCLKPKASQHLARGLLLLVPVVGALFLYFYYDPKKKRERIETYMRVLRDPHFDQISPDTPTKAHWDYLSHFQNETLRELNELHDTHPLEEAVFQQLRGECRLKQNKITPHLRIREIFETPERRHQELVNVIYSEHHRLQGDFQNVPQALQDAFNLWGLAIHRAPTPREKVTCCEDVLPLFLEWYAQRQGRSISMDQRARFVLGNPDAATKALLDGIRQDPEFCPIFLSLLNTQAATHEQILHELENLSCIIVRINHINCALRYTAILDPDNSAELFNRAMALWETAIQRDSSIELVRRAIEVLFDWYAFLEQKTLPESFSVVAFTLQATAEMIDLLDEVKLDPTYWSRLEPWLALCNAS